MLQPLVAHQNVKTVPRGKASLHYLEEGSQLSHHNNNTCVSTCRKLQQPHCIGMDQTLNNYESLQ